MNRRTLLGLLATAPLLATPASAGPMRVFSVNGLAIRGVDPVAYFAKEQAVLGSSDHMLMWRGAIWRFETAANMAAFERNPAAYAPRYGGYCALALSWKSLSTTDPEAWVIHEDRLYLHHSANDRERWLADITGNIAKADANWPNVLQS